jgi:hypothetical protein
MYVWTFYCLLVQVLNPPLWYVGIVSAGKKVFRNNKCILGFGKRDFEDG